jgi:hypothetical protein
MKKNIGTTDRIIRIVLALVLFFFAWQFQSVLLLLGGVFCLYEALISWCAFYALMGRNTCPLQ